MIVETSAAISNDPRVFGEISGKHCNIAIWDRALPLDATDLLKESPKSLRLNVDIDNCVPLLQDALKQAGYANSNITAQLINDIADLCVLFEPYIETPKLEVRLEIVDNDACRKFHSDFVTMRLITTYVGPGTQWLDNNPDHAAGVVNPNSIHEMKAGAVGIFKGRRSTLEPAIHRSPPIEGTGQKRLVLVLNPYENNDW